MFLLIQSGQRPLCFQGKDYEPFSFSSDTGRDFKKLSLIALLPKSEQLQCSAAVIRSSAVVLLLIAQVQLAQLPLSHPPSFVGLGGAAGARGLGGFGAVAARGRPLQEVLGDAALQVLHGGRRRHADDPGVFEGLTSCETLAGVHGENPLHKVFGQVRDTGPRLERGDINRKRLW